MSAEVAYDQLDDSVQQVSIETILSSDGGWTDQQNVLDKRVAEYLSDEDLDAISLSEFLLTIAQFKLQLYHSSTLFQNTSIFGLGTGLDFDVDVCTLPAGQLVVAKRVKLLTPLHRRDGSSVSDLSRRVRKVLQEIRILKHAPVENCDSILNIVGASLEDVSGDFTAPSLVLEYAEFGTLRHYLLKSSSPRPMQEKQELCLQVGRALLTLHNCGICHGDVKLDNVLVVRDQDGKGSAKVADFGSSIIIQSDNLKKTYWGTNAYNAPEVRSSDNTQSGVAVGTDLLFACDVFSFGLLLYESLHDGVPYWKAHKNEVPTIQTALDISNFEGCEDTEHDQSDSTRVVCFRRAIGLSLVPLPEERRQLRPILEAIAGNTDGFDTGSCHQINLREERPLNLINLADPATLFALLTGGGHYMSQRVAPRSPLGIQDILFSAYQRHSLSTNAILSAFMHMQLAICYLVGFGVDRNMNQVHKNLAVAAGSQYPSIRPLLVRLRQAFDLGQAEQPLPPLVDKMATRNVSILLAAIEQPVYSSPLYEIGQVWKKTQVEELGIGSELHHAAYIGEVEGAARLLQQGQSDHLNETGHTALMLACIDGSLPMVRLLAENGSNLQVKDPDGYTVWHMLTMFPSADIVPTASLFFTHSKDSDLINTYSPSPYILPEMFDALIGTPLHWAIQTNNLGAVEALLESGAKTDIQYNGLLSPIELAASLRLHSVLEILFKHAKLRSTDLSVEMPLFSMNECHPLRLVFLHGANLKDSTTKTVELLVKYWNIDTLNSVGWTPVLKLCLTGFSDIDKDLVLTMLRWAQPHVEGQQYPLIIASLLGCMNNKPSNSSLPVNLIDQGLPLTATTSSSDGRGYNVLHWAAAFQNIAVIQATLNKDPQLVNSPTVSPAGEYPLNIAATQSNSEGLLRTLKTLAEAGADPTAESKEHGLTPLGSFIAEQPADFDGPAFEYLLSINKANGFIVTQLELNPWTALHLATDLAASFTVLDNFKPLNLLRHALQFEEIKGLLEGRTKEGFTPILLAAMHADYATVRVLAEAGADITVMSHRGSTCMSLLLEQSRRPLSQLARQFGTKWNGENFRAKWLHNAYRAAAYVSERLGTVSGYNGLVLPKLHVAAYMCYRIEVKRLVESGEDVNSTVGSRATKTARGLLEGIISLAEERGRPWPKDALADAQEVIEYLKLRERPQESGEDP